jgi:hypothetical protein
MRRILLSPHVSKGAQIAYLFCVDEGWVAISEKDKKELNYEKNLTEDSFEEFQVIAEDELYIKIPFLKNQLQEEDHKFIAIDYKNGKVHVNPLHKTKSIFTDTSARATNQSNFEPSTWAYIKNRRSKYLRFTVICFLLILASLYVSWSIFILLFWVVFYQYFGTLAMLDNYNLGTLNAAKVITINPTRLAVLTDVSMGFGTYPLVRVYKINLPKKYTKLNQKIPTSCGYQNCESQKYWDYVIPNPIVFATNDEQAIAQKIEEIPTQDWIDLNNWIKVNKHNFFEGYYPIRNVESNWAEIEDPKFISFYDDERPENMS